MKTISITKEQAEIFEILLIKNRDSHKLQKITNCSYLESINLLNDLRKNKEQNNVFVLFETDLQKSRSSRVLLGIFDSEKKAIDTAKENDCYRNDCEVLIIEAELNNFEEL